MYMCIDMLVCLATLCTASLVPVTIGMERIHSQHWYSDYSEWTFILLCGLIYMKYMLGAPIQEPAALALYTSTLMHTAVLLVKRFSTQMAIPKSQFHFSSYTVHFWNSLDEQNIECH